VRLKEYMAEIKIECKENVVREIPELPEDMELRKMMQENYEELKKSRK
jgi:hypothetical protein